MNSMTGSGHHKYSLIDAMRARIVDYLQGEFERQEGHVGDLDRWTRRRITEENLAKLELVMAADEPSEACYRDLIREIDAEAEMGIFLARRAARMTHLAQIVDEPGVSGELHGRLERIAPVLFADELLHSSDDLDLVRVTVQAGHDRAYFVSGGRVVHHKMTMVK